MQIRNRTPNSQVELEVTISEEKLDDDEVVDVLEFNDCEAELICGELCVLVDDADEDEETGPGLADVVLMAVVSEVPVAAGVELAKTVWIVKVLPLESTSIC
jgi:hypothetical protein